MEYLTTKERLEAVSVAALGAMTSDTYAGFIARAQATGLERPRLMLTWVFSRDTPMGYQAGAEVVYPIVEREWASFLADIPAYCAEPPHVFVVDGLRYTAPI